MLTWIFGNRIRQEVHLTSDTRMAGFMELERATVRWFLSVDGSDLPPTAVKAGSSTFRSITIDGDEIEFSDGFGDLHTLVYKDILCGGGFGLDDARQAIDIVYEIRAANTVIGKGKQLHPMLSG
jgi:UDP-N-acetyl-2-amino-2-deoxyglucuronate dehydrogenase